MMNLIFLHISFVILFCQNKVKKICKYIVWVLSKNIDMTVGNIHRKNVFVWWGFIVMWEIAITTVLYGYTLFGSFSYFRERLYVYKTNLHRISTKSCLVYSYLFISDKSICSVSCGFVIYQTLIFVFGVTEISFGLKGCEAAIFVSYKIIIWVISLF